MTPLQSMIVLLILVALAASPAVVTWALRKDKQDEQPQLDAGVPDRLQVQAVVARHMYSKAVGGDRVAMFDYDESPALQAMWYAEAGYKLKGR